MVNCCSSQFNCVLFKKSLFFYETTVKSKYSIEIGLLILIFIQKKTIFYRYKLCNTKTYLVERERLKISVHYTNREEESLNSLTLACELYKFLNIFLYR